MNSIGEWAETATPWMSDPILTFDITLGAANEYDAPWPERRYSVWKSSMKIQAFRSTTP